MDVVGIGIASRKRVLDDVEGVLDSLVVVDIGIRHHLALREELTAVVLGESQLQVPVAVVSLVAIDEMPSRTKLMESSGNRMEYLRTVMGQVVQLGIDDLK